MIYYRGMKLVYIAEFNNKNSHEWKGNVFPIIGNVYTIRDIIEYSDGFGLLLEEIVNKKYIWWDGFREITFDVERFRPLVKTEYNLSIFTELLVNEKVDA